MAINRNEFFGIRNLQWGGGLFLLLFLGFCVFFSWQSWQTEKTEEIQNLSALAELGEKALDSYFSQFERALDMLSRDLTDKDGGFDAHRVKAVLKRFIEVHTELSDISLVRLDGQILVTGKSALGARLPSVGKEPSFSEARDELLKGRTLSIARPLIGLVSKEWGIPFRYGIRDDKGNLVLILTARMPLSKPQSFWENAPLPEGAAAGLLRRDDDYLVSRYPIPRDVEMRNIYGRPMTGILSQHLRREPYPVSGVVEGTGSLAGPEQVFVFRRLAHYPLTFFVVTPLANIRAHWWQQNRTSYLLMLVLLAGGFTVFRSTLKRQIAWESEMRQAQTELQSREQQFGLILDAIPALVAYFDAEQRYRFVNRAFEKWHGISRAEILGKTLNDFRGEEAYRQRQPYIEATLSGRTITVEDYFDFPGWGRRYVLVNQFPDFTADGTIKGFYTIITDLTEQKESHERELEKEKTLRDTLVREIQHRVKNALQGAILLMDTSRKARPELADAMEPAVIRLHAMAEVFSLQASSGDQHVLLCNLVEAICGTLAKATGCAVEPVIENDLVRPAQLAETEIVPVALIVNELVFNAIKHGRPGEPVKVFLNDGGESVSVRIVTTGAVLPPGFDFESGAGEGTGLRLVKSMLRPESATLAFTSGSEGVTAELVLRPPAIKRVEC